MFVKCKPFTVVLKDERKLVRRSSLLRESQGLGNRYLKGVWYGSLHGASLDGLGAAVAVEDDVVQELAGEWVCVDFSDNRFRLFTDYFGYYKVFYTTPADNGVGVFAVSDCFDSLVVLLEQCGSVVELDESNFYSSLNLNMNGYFFEQFHSEGTMCKQIRILHFDEEIVAQDGCEANVSRKPLCGHADLSYDALLDLGIESSIDMLRSVSDFSKPVDIDLFLSGGKDSRAVLALTLSALPKSRFSTRTHVPRNGSPQRIKDDYSLATDIVKSFDISRRSEDRALLDRINFSYEQAVKNWKSLYSNTTFNKILKPFHDVRSWAVELRGGGGDLLRGPEYLYNNTPNAGLNEDGYNKILADFIARRISRYVGAEEKNKAVNILSEYVTNLPGESLYDKLDYYYTRHRNRTHFGHIRESYQQSALVLFPLSNKYLYWASMRLESSERKSGRVIYDLINRLSPQLLKIPFEGSPLQPSPNREGEAQVQSRLSGYHRFSQNSIPAASSSSFKSVAHKDIFRMLAELCAFDESRLKYAELIRDLQSEKFVVDDRKFYSALLKFQSAFSVVSPSFTDCRVYYYRV